MEITAESFTTVAGAVAGVALLTQFIKIFWKDATNAQLRMLAAALGLVGVLVATAIVNGGLTWSVGFAGMFAGITAGLAASQGYEMGADGLGHVTVSDSDDGGH